MLKGIIYISIFACFSNSKGSSNSDFEDEDNNYCDVSIIIGDEKISDISLDFDIQVTLSIILICDSSSCICHVLFKTTSYMEIPHE